MYARCVLDLLNERGLLPPRWRACWVAEGNGTDADTLLERMVTAGALTSDVILEALARELGMQRVEPGPLKAEADAISLVSAAFAREWGILPLRRTGEVLEVAISNPYETRGLDQLGQGLNLILEPRLADPGQLMDGWRRHYGPPSAEDPPLQVEEEAAVIQAGSAGSGCRDWPGGMAGDEPIRRYAEAMIEEALERRASDIHLETTSERLRIRFRVDGSLVEIPGPPAVLRASIITHLKLESGMSISEQRLPQDGRMGFRSGERRVDLRVSSVPGIHGEHLVLRVLDGSGRPPELAELGMADDDQEKLMRMLEAPQGALLVTGPTGSGKTTTLYACLRICNRPDSKIVTAEDPIEYVLPGVTQARVRAQAGMGFAEALRAILRQAPNIIMVGEIRDLETAEVAFHAALTGHAVFTTLHTNDAAAAISRLIDIGIPRFVVAAALRVVLAQRLVRRVCPECGAPEQIPVCRGCSGTGFHGRCGLFEFMPITEDLRQAILQDPSELTLRTSARRDGMRTMREDGMRKALAGLTTVDEVLAATMEANETRAGADPATQLRESNDGRIRAESTVSRSPRARE